MMEQKRACDHNILGEWIGIHRQEELPILQLNMSDVKDPIILKGLQKIQTLDEQLHAKTVELKVVDRETFPQKCQEIDNNAYKKRELSLAKALEKLRQKRNKAIQLRQKLNTIDEGSDQCNIPSFKYGKLSEENERLVEIILNREQEPDPYEDVQEVLLSTGQCLSISELNQKLEDYAMDHEWDENGTLYDIRSVLSEEVDVSCRSSMRGYPPISLSSQDISTAKQLCANGKVDYLREQREDKLMKERQKQITRQLQHIWMNCNEEILQNHQVKALVEECRKQQEAASQRTSKQNSQAQSEVSEDFCEFIDFPNLNLSSPSIEKYKQTRLPSINTHNNL